MRVGEVVRDATAGIWRNPWLLLPLAVALAYGSIGGLLALSPATVRFLSGYGLIGSLLSPAYLAWWVGWSGEAAQGRRLRPADLMPTLARAAWPMYMILFAYRIGMVVLLRILPLAGAIGILIPLALNPWIDFAAAGDLGLDRIGERMRDPMYWAVAASGLGFAALGLWMQISPSLVTGANPAVSLVTVAAYIVATWLWAVRSLLLVRPGTWQNARMRRFLRDSQRSYDDDEG